VRTALVSCRPSDLRQRRPDTVFEYLQLKADLLVQRSRREVGFSHWRCHQVPPLTPDSCSLVRCLPVVMPLFSSHDLLCVEWNVKLYYLNCCFYCERQPSIHCSDWVVLDPVHIDASAGKVCCIHAACLPFFSASKVSAACHAASCSHLFRCTTGMCEVWTVQWFEWHWWSWSKPLPCGQSGQPQLYTTQLSPQAGPRN